MKSPTKNLATITVDIQLSSITLNTPLLYEIIDLAINQKKSGIPIIDNIINDSLKYKRMATEIELNELKNKNKLYIFTNYTYNKAA
jgi:hypothetical protein